MRHTLLPLCVLPLLACEQPREITSAAGDLATVVEGQNQLALDLMAVVPEDGNLFISPFSINSALGMTMVGAAGQTLEEMREVLHVSVDDAVFHQQLGALSRDLAGDHHRAYSLLSGNRLWGQDGLVWKQPMLDTCSDDYGADLETVDFAGDTEGARKDINRWVSKLTDGMIDEALQAGDVTAATRLVLTNAIYFHADWATPFEEEATSQGDFTRADGSVVSTPLMSGTLPASYYGDETVSVLSLPYEGQEISLLVMLPSAADGLDELEASLSPAQIETWVSGMSETEVFINLPRFSMRSRLNLADSLADLGMPTAFDGGADFSNMTDDAGLYIGRVVHEAVIDLDEQGTRAAAFTGVVMDEVSYVETPEFVANHPFLFAIRDDLTGTILFIGRMTDPSVSAPQG